MDIISAILERLDASNLRDSLFYLSGDPLPCRTLNFTRPGAEKCTLYEADDFIAGKLSEFGVRVETETVPVQAFQVDTSVPHGFRQPFDSEPWYDAVNIYGKIVGKAHPQEAIVLIAHKDSQSWLPCAPGAYDNGVGVASLLEMARFVGNYKFQRSVIFLFPNEEH